jgi:hypothetical protein
MSKLLLIFGVVFLAVGAALSVMLYYSPGQMQVLALTPEVAAIFLVGGPVCMGVGNLIGAVMQTVMRSLPAVPHESTVAVVTHPGAAPADVAPPSGRSQSFGTRPAVAGAAAGAAAAIAAKAADDATTIASQVTTAGTTSVQETISALEQAKTDIAVALGLDPKETAAEKAAAPAVEDAPSAADMEVAQVAEEAADEPDLYVVEEKVIRGRPARVLSDGTVEAETDEGWMRFENLEHLDEYLEAMVPEA